MRRLLVHAALLLSCVAPAAAQIYRVAEMNAEQIAALDRQRTVVILTGGILEQHGPHTPSFTDGFSNQYLTERLAERLVQRPGQAVLLFPMIPLGHAGANEIANRHVFPGTYSIRRSTLRAIFMDLATELGAQGFRTIFIIHGHGAPWHNLALDQAGEYFHDTFGGRMVHIRGLLPTDEQLKRLNVPPPPVLELTGAERAEIGDFDEHAGFEETSRMMFLRPDLVSPAVKQLPSLTVNNPQEFFSRSRQPDWRGYLSAPRLASASHGARLQMHRAERDIALALAILDGRIDERDIPRYSSMMTGDPGVVQALAGSAEQERAIEQKQRAWMVKKGIKE